MTAWYQLLLSLFLEVLLAVRSLSMSVTEFLPSTTTPCEEVETSVASFTVTSAVE